MRKLIWSVLIAALPPGEAAPLPLQAAAVGLQEDEYAIKGALITHFVRMCDWPERALPKDAAQFTLGLIGPDEVCEQIRKQTEGKKVGARTIKVVQGAAPGDLGAANLVFLAAAEKEQSPALIKAFRISPVLTVSEIPGFAKEGGTLNFFFVEENGKKKTRFELNLDAAERTGVKVTRLIPVATRKLKDD